MKNFNETSKIDKFLEEGNPSKATQIAKQLFWP